jgi:hypothetical protein
MLHAVISHCPNCPALQDYLSDVVAALESQEVAVELADGTRGEFTVAVNGRRVVAETVKTLPPVAAVRDAVRRERVTGRFARPHTWL